MCGFFGAINNTSSINFYSSDLSHRGPNSQREYVKGELYLKHFRLAILGEEKYAAQPITSYDGNIVLVFNGEIYNYKELAVFMESPHLSNHGDTRVLVEFFARYGLKRLDMLNGMFAIAVYDNRDRALYLIRDRFGVKPLYYMRHKGAIYFASEIKCFKNVKPLSLNRQRAIDYLDMGIYPSQKNVFFEDITQVEPGTLIKYKDSKLTETVYYDLKKECMALMGSKLSIKNYEDLLGASIKLRLRSNVPISLHYSGGTDSTALLLKTKEVWGWDYPLVTYTMAYREKKFDESHIAESYCNKIGVKNKKVFLSWKEVPRLAGELHNFVDEPYGGIPTIAYYKMNRKERDDGYIVSIEGQGGDETFGGYRYHIFMAMYDLYSSGKNRHLLNRLLKINNTTLENVIDTARRLINSGFSVHTDLTDFRKNKKVSVSCFLDWLKTIQIYDILQNKLPRTLRFNDRASMTCGREVRFPYLDHNVLVYGLAFGHALKYREGLSKYPLRMIIKRHIKGAYSDPKRSLVTPQTYWLKNQLKTWAFERVNILKKTSLIPERSFVRFFDFYKQNNPDNSFYIWQLINLSFLLE